LIAPPRCHEPYDTILTPKAQVLSELASIDERLLAVDHRSNRRDKEPATPPRRILSTRALTTITHEQLDDVLE